ncbi:MAG: hypothetical protein HY543_08155 [Deltaproteobacteria bacterium]|nr:hypothetical protein [Deltaproteobacteria bacterium]
MRSAAPSPPPVLPWERQTPLAILTELTYPDYRSRHLVTARLRLLIFIGFWFFYVSSIGLEGAYHGPLLAVIAAAFVITCVAYYNIFIDRFIGPSLIAEVLADLVGLTTVVYLTGGVDSEYYYLYVFYVLLSGIFYSERVAFGTAAASLLFYAGFLTLLSFHVLPPLHPEIVMSAEVHHLLHGHHPHPFWNNPALGHSLFLAGLLTVGVYAIKVSRQLGQLRERFLEARNRELQSLHEISSAVRQTGSLEQAVERVLVGIDDALQFTLCLLMLRDRSRQRFVCYPPRHHPVVARAERALGLSLRELSMPVGEGNNAVFRQLQEKKVIFRKYIVELMEGIRPAIPAQQIMQLQDQLGIRKVIAIPLVAERDVIGTLLGFTDEAFVNERVVATFETFANHAALLLQTTQLIEELKLKNRELEEANRVKSEFLATMSHELRTPLTAIIGFSELLLEGVMGELSAEQQESLREVLNNGANLLALINNLLDLAKMESGRFTMVFERFDLRQMLDRTVHTLGSLIQRKALAYTSVFPEDLPPIVADERRIQQVVLNLLGNAIKFTPEGGRIRLEVGGYPSIEALPDPRWRDRIVDRGAMAHGCIAVRVSDTGIGIPANQLETIFDMFKQVDSSATRSYEGTGLGLALAKQLVELHHGVIWAESEEPHGTTFTCLLPIDARSREGTA